MLNCYCVVTPPPPLFPSVDTLLACKIFSTPMHKLLVGTGYPRPFSPALVCSAVSFPFVPPNHSAYSPVVLSSSYHCLCSLPWMLPPSLACLKRVAPQSLYEAITPDSSLSFLLAFSFLGSSKGIAQRYFNPIWALTCQSLWVCSLTQDSVSVSILPVESLQRGLAQIYHLLVFI